MKRINEKNNIKEELNKLLESITLLEDKIEEYSFNSNDNTFDGLNLFTKPLIMFIDEIE